VSVHVWPRLLHRWSLLNTVIKWKRVSDYGQWRKLMLVPYPAWPGSAWRVEHLALPKLHRTIFIPLLLPYLLTVVGEISSTKRERLDLSPKCRLGFKAFSHYELTWWPIQCEGSTWNCRYCRTAWCFRNVKGPTSDVRPSTPALRRRRELPTLTHTLRQVSQIGPRPIRYTSNLL
jgi:hypothetical protein